MSIPVDLAALRAEVGRFGADALLVTVPADGHPHVSSVLVSFEGDELTMRVGRSTRANAARRPAVTLVWPGAPGAAYSLIVDGTAAGDQSSEGFVVHPTSAVLHRLATAPDELPGCVPVDDSTAVRRDGSPTRS